MDVVRCGACMSGLRALESALSVAAKSDALARLSRQVDGIAGRIGEIVLIQSDFG